jgi:hypothetical protein
MDISFEAQRDDPSARRCGAASLTMVYRSLGLNVSQESIWPSIAIPDSENRFFARTYLMCQDALARGFSAIVVRASEPLRLLEACQRFEVRAILNHRSTRNPQKGHYTVLKEIAGDDVVLHDPEVGPSQRIRLPELLAIWQPLDGNVEITGNILICIGREVESVQSCKICGKSISQQAPCWNCNRMVPLQPTIILGCDSPSCSGRNWQHVICPFCDEVMLQ